MSATIWETVKNAMSGLSIPTAANVYIPPSGSALPDLFVTYQVLEEPSELSADNDESLKSWTVQVTIWSRAGLPGIPTLHQAMLDAGFHRKAGRELPYQQDTRHYGYAADYVFLEEV